MKKIAKKLLIMIALVIVILGENHEVAHAEEKELLHFKCDYYKGEAELTGLDWNSGRDEDAVEYIEIPEYYDGCRVVSIGWQAFFCSNIKYVSVPSGVRTIKKGAFYRCQSLQEVRFASSSELEEIQENAFFECKSLSQIELPEGLKKIKQLAFSKCESLESIKFPSTLVELEYGVFANCTKLSDISLNEGIKIIGPQAFENTAISSINIPSSVETLDAGVFKDCKNLKNITPKLTQIPRLLFEGCVRLESVEIDDSVQMIGEEAFKGTSLRLVVLPSELKEIEADAFSECDKLTDVYFKCEPESISGFEGRTVLHGKSGGIVEKYAQREGMKFCGYKSAGAVVAKNKDNKQIKLTWNEVEDCGEYKVYRAENDAKNFKLLATVSKNSYVDKTIKRGTKYFYYVGIDLIHDGISISNVKSSTASVKIAEATISSNKTSYTVKRGKWIKIRVKYIKRGTLYAKNGSSKITGKWGDGWDGDYATYYVKGIKRGKTKVTFTNSKDKEKLVVNIRVK